MANKDYILITPVRTRVSEWDRLEYEITRAFFDVLYKPLLKSLGIKRPKLKNAKDKNPLVSAINDGSISFNHGVFRGKFSAGVSKELKKLGATWDKKNKTWQLTLSLMPKELRDAIAASKAKWEKTQVKIEKQLRQNLPAKIAEKVKSEPLFELGLRKIDKNIDNTLKSISVLPKLTDERLKIIAKEWRNNLDLWITNFAEEEIPKLRDKVSKQILSGGRFEDLIPVIQKSYGVTRNKAKFLARQETNLLLTTFKETRYAEAGIKEYIWQTVVGSPKHPVRPSHAALRGKIFRFDDPPITTAPGEPVRRNNPGEDYNCRCFARPVIRKRKTP